MLTKKDGFWLKVISMRYGDEALRGNWFDDISEASRGSI